MFRPGRAVRIDANKGSHYPKGVPREYVEIRVRSVLNRVRGMPFRWSINPYRGCAHACVFCYARRTHGFLEEDGIHGWSNRIFVKVNAPEVLRAELLHPAWKREEVAIGTATDPYQPIEGRYRITRQILEALCDARTPVSLVTRSPLILRDLDVLLALHQRARVTVWVSIATLDEPLSRAIEPGVAPPHQRLRTVARLSAVGLAVGVLVAPILPGLTDAPETLEAVIRVARDHGARFLGHSVLNLGEVAREAFFQFLQEHHPELGALYERLYPRKYAPRAYVDAVDRTVKRCRERFGFRDRPRPSSPQQLLLLPRIAPEPPSARGKVSPQALRGTARGPARGLPEPPDSGCGRSGEGRSAEPEGIPLPLFGRSPEA